MYLQETLSLFAIYMQLIKMLKTECGILEQYIAIELFYKDTLLLYS